MFKKTKRIRPTDEAKFYVLSSRDKPGLQEKFIDSNKGRGVFATQPIEPGAFVVEYRGELISAEECRSRQYSETQSTFLFDFQWQQRHWCIDASREDGSLGRLVNDNHKSPNCTMKKIIVNGRPHLCLFAVKNIEAGTEIEYNYGDSNWPWREKVINKQASAVSVETVTFPKEPTSLDGSIRDETSSQEINKQAPAVAVETTTFPKDPTSLDGSIRDDASSQEINKQAPAVAVETTTFPKDPTSLDGSIRDVASSQVVTVRGFPLVEYSDTDETDEDGIKDQAPIPHCDDLFQKTRGMDQILMDREPDVSDSLYDSDESIVHGTDDDNSSVELNSEVVPKLRRTKSILMRARAPHFSDALYDSSDDGTESPSISRSEMASQRQRRACSRPIQISPVGSDDSSVVSEEEYIPNPKDESTDSDCCLELKKKRKHNISSTSQSQKSFKSSSQGSFKSSSQGSFKSSSQGSFKSSSKGSFKSSSKGSFKSSSKGSFKSSSQDNVESSSKSSSKSSCQNSFSSSSLSHVKSSNPKSFKSPSQGSVKSSSQGSVKSSSQSQLESSKSTSSEARHDSTFPDSRVDENEKQMAQAYTNEEASVSVHLENEPSVYVDPVLKKEDGGRIYNKKHHCLYCQQVVQKISRHLSRKHTDKADVAKALSFPKYSKERRQQLDYIRNQGNFEHNVGVLDGHEGKLIPCKQPKRKMEGNKFMHCVYCYGLFTRSVMWRHFKICKFNSQGKKNKPGKNRVQALCAFGGSAPDGFSDAYWKFLSDMNQDEIAVAVKQDHSILEYGYRLFRKNERVISQHRHIRQKLRELGRLVLAAKKVTPVKTIRELIKPEKYGHAVTAARCLAGFSDVTGKYQCPSLARKVGHSLHSLAMFLKSEGLKMKDKETVQNAEEFAQLYKESWKFDIASQALTQLDQAKWNSPELLPFTQDVQKLHSYLSEKQQQHLNDLKEEVSSSNWKNLAKVTLAQVILFNRRREGEVSKMPLSVYASRESTETHEDVNLALTPLEQKLCKHFVRITIVGKRGRKVPVLLTPLMRESLDTLVEKREECGVLNENGFLFALPHSVHHLRGSDCIRQFVHECDVKTPRALTSTKLRKHIATLSTVLNLKTTELDQLADFLGHNISVHRKHYRLPEGTLQLAKISKVLLALEQGRLGEYKGKSLDEINIDANETVAMETVDMGSSQEDIAETVDMETVDMGSSQEDTEDTGMQEDEDSVMSLQKVSSTVSVQIQRKSAKKRDASMQQDHSSEDDSITSLQEDTSTVSTQNQRKSAKKCGKQTALKRSWTPEECAAVDKHLRRYMVMNQVPGKTDCQRCITAEPQALRNRDWKSIKYFIKNRITALRRKADL